MFSIDELLPKTETTPAKTTEPSPAETKPETPAKKPAGKAPPADYTPVESGAMDAYRVNPEGTKLDVWIKGKNYAFEKVTPEEIKNFLAEAKKEKPSWGKALNQLQQTARKRVAFTAKTAEGKAAQGAPPGK